MRHRTTRLALPALAALICCTASGASANEGQAANAGFRVAALAASPSREARPAAVPTSPATRRTTTAALPTTGAARPAAAPRPATASARPATGATRRAIEANRQAAAGATRPVAGATRPATASARLTAAPRQTIAARARISCVPYARMVSGIDLRGNAREWWHAAEGRFDRSQAPETGAVLSFPASGGMRLGHVAVVERVLGARHILVHHANWEGPGIRKGTVTRGISVIDVSPGNDWTQVRVQAGLLHGVYGRAYPTHGFIHNRAPRTEIREASAQPGTLPAPPPAPPTMLAGAGAPPAMLASLPAPPAAVPGLPAPPAAAPGLPASPADVAGLPAPPAARPAAPIELAQATTGMSPHLTRHLSIAAEALHARD